MVSINELLEQTKRGGRALMALTKAQIAETLAEKNGFAKNKSIEIVEDLIEIIKRTLESGEDVLIRPS